VGRGIMFKNKEKRRDIMRVIKLIKKNSKLLEDIDDFHEALREAIKPIIGEEPRFPTCKLERITDGKNFALDLSYKQIEENNELDKKLKDYISWILGLTYQIQPDVLSKWDKYELDQISDYDQHIYPICTTPFISLLEVTEMFEYDYFKKFDYYSEDFRKLRIQVFLRDGEVCAYCKAIPSPGLSLTIDHIKPVSKFPELALDIDNLQVLCWECNQKKSNKY
jgi:hypothetical protein